MLEDYFDVIGPYTIHIKGHRIGIEHVVEHYLDGYSPEQIAQEFPGLSLEAIYTTIAYYLRHKADIDAYLARQAAWVEQRMREAEQEEQPPVVQRLRALQAERIER